MSVKRIDQAHVVTDALGWEDARRRARHIVNSYPYPERSDDEWVEHLLLFTVHMTTADTTEKLTGIPKSAYLRLMNIALERL